MSGFTSTKTGLQSFNSIAYAEEIHVLDVVIISLLLFRFKDFIAIISASVPEFTFNEYLHLKILMEATGSQGSYTDKGNKIIKKIAKAVSIDKEACP